MRHYVERLTPKGVDPAEYSQFALCGKKMEEIVLEHNASICQACIDKARNLPVEK